MDFNSLEKIYDIASRINLKVAYNNIQHGCGIGIVKANPGGGVVYVEKVDVPPNKDPKHRIVPHVDCEEGRNGFFIPVKDLRLLYQGEMSSKE